MSRIRYTDHKELDYLSGRYPLTWPEMIDDIGISWSKQVEVYRSWGLSKRQMECVSLYYVNKKTYREIGEILGIAYTAAYIYVKRAKKKINRCLTNRY